MSWSDPITSDLILGFALGCAFMALMMWRVSR